MRPRSGHPNGRDGGDSRGAELGILIKNGEALETSQRLSTILLDKTGTLTKGRPEVTDVVSVAVAERELLQIAAGVEKNASHPLAEAIERKALEQGIELPKVERFDTFEGKGVRAVVDGKDVVIGNRIFLEDNGVWRTAPSKKKSSGSRPRRRPSSSSLSAAGWAASSP